jgi:class 3 adenylate cyclase
MSPSDTVSMLNAHMTEMNAIVHRHNGVIDKFIGDEIMAVFGIPQPQPDDALSAVRAAIDMIHRRRELNSTADPPIEIGVGISSGDVLVGCMGSEDRLNYTVLGARVNLAARLCSKAAGLEILIDKATAGQIKNQVAIEAIGEIELKGFRDAAAAHRVILN